MDKSLSDKNKTQALLLINRIIHVVKVNSPSLRFELKKRLKYCLGDITYEILGDSQTIRIGLFYPIVPVLIHECIHHLHPEWSETKVLKWEKTVKRWISIKQALKMLKLFVNIMEKNV
jgi:hypothetical protein